MKQITITVPDNCELKQDGNVYTIVEKEKKVTYVDVAAMLFPVCNEHDTHFSIEEFGSVKEVTNYISNYKSPIDCTSKRQADKLLAINKLMNVAKYLNGDWQPDWSNDCEDKYYLSVVNGHIRSYFVETVQCSDVYFKSKELAEQAIDILGEETIMLALCTDY